MSKFQPGQSGNAKGRPVGSKNKLPDRNELCDLLDRIVSDFNENYSVLTINQKIRLLSHFATLYNDSTMRDLKATIEQLGSEANVIKFEFDLGGDELNETGS